MPIYHATPILTGVTSHDGQSPISIRDVTPAQWNAALVDEDGTAFTPSATDLNIFDGHSGVSAAEFGFLDASASAYAETAGRPFMVAQATLDATGVAGDRTVAAHDTGVTIPANSIILGGIYDVQETFTDGDDDSATIAIKVEGANDIVTATAISDGTPFDQGLHAVIPVFSAATAVKTTVARNIVFTVGDAALTAGTMTVSLFYIPTIVDTA